LLVFLMATIWSPRIGTAQHARGTLSAPELTSGTGLW